MFSPKSFRHQIVFSFSIVFAVLWGGSILIFRNHLADNFTKDQQANFNHHQKSIYQQIKNLQEDNRAILKKISSQLNENMHNPVEYIREIWNNKLLKPDNINLSHYDKDHIHTEISNNYESFFYSPLALEKSIMSPYNNLIEGGHFFHCKETCRFYYIKPVSNRSFDQGIFQISLTLDKLTQNLIQELSDVDIFVLKKNLMVAS